MKKSARREHSPFVCHQPSHANAVIAQHPLGQKTRIAFVTLVKPEGRVSLSATGRIDPPNGKAVPGKRESDLVFVRCGFWRQTRCKTVHQVEETRRWRDLSLRNLPIVLHYRPRRVRCPRCGVWVEAVPWAQLGARVTTALARAVAELARHLSWQETARHFRLDGKSVATIVRRVVAYGLAGRRRRPLHLLGVDEVSRRKGHHYLTVVYDLECGVLLWVGEDRTEESLTRFFTELGRRRSATLQVACLDMWQAYLKAVQNHASNAQILFDRFPLVQHLNRAVDEVRRSEMRRLNGPERTFFKLKNPWNLRTDERERLSTLVRWNTPIVRAYYLKEAFQLFWDYRQPARAEQHLRRWMHSAMRSRLEPFKRLVRRLRAHLDGVLAWTRLRLSSRALEA